MILWRKFKNEKPITGKECIIKENGLCKIGKFLRPWEIEKEKYNKTYYVFKSTAALSSGNYYDFDESAEYAYLEEPEPDYVAERIL